MAGALHAWRSAAAAPGADASARTRWPTPTRTQAGLRRGAEDGGRRGARRDLDAMRGARASTCAPTSTAAERCASTGRAHRGGRRGGPGRDRERLHERVAELARRAAGRRDRPSRRKSSASSPRSDISEEVARFRGTSRTGTTLAGQRRAVRPQARLPAAGDEPRGQHDGVEGRRPRVSELIIAAKAELEKMREQVQNVE